MVTFHLGKHDAKFICNQLYYWMYNNRHFPTWSVGCRFNCCCFFPPSRFSLHFQIYIWKNLQSAMSKLASIFGLIYA
ncbi:mCG144966 [Mus musculus]|nr:mCG144966 [Mus musculus]